MDPYCTKERSIPMTTMRVLRLKAYLALFLAVAVALVLANGQLHDPFNARGVTCGGDPAAYGLESAHHGPDSGAPGKADGCYQVDSIPPGSDDNNPAIN